MATALVAGMAQGAIGQAIASMAINMVFSMVLKKMMGGDKQPPSPQAPRDPGVEVRAEANTENKLPVLYGQVRTRGITLYADISSDNQKLAFIIGLGEGPISKIGIGQEPGYSGIFWDDKELQLSGNPLNGKHKVTNTIDSEGQNDDYLNDNLFIRVYPEGGRCTEMESFSDRWQNGTTENPITDLDTQRSLPDVAYMYVELEYNREKNVTGLTNDLSAVVEGKLVASIIESNNQILLSSGNTQDAPAFNGTYSGVGGVTVFVNDSTPIITQSTAVTGITTAMQQFTVATDEKISVDVSQGGTLRIYDNNPVEADRQVIAVYRANGLFEQSGTFRFDYETNSSSLAFYSGTTSEVSKQITFLNDTERAVVLSSVSTGGVQILSPGDPIIVQQGGVTTNSSFRVASDGGLSRTYSNNPAECLLDYMLNARYGAGNVINMSDIDLQSFYDHKVFCDETPEINLSDGTVVNDRKRYTLNGWIDTEQDRDSLIQDFCTASQALFRYSGGKFSMVSDAPAQIDEPVMSFRQFPIDGDGNRLSSYPSNQSPIYGDVNVANNGFESLINELTLRFDSVQRYQKEEQIFLSVASDLLNQNEPVLEETVDLKMTNNNVEAERLGQIMLNKAREQQVISFTTDLTALALEAGDVIDFTYEPYGIDTKKYQIQSLREAEIEGGIRGVDVTAQEYNALSYAGSILTLDQLAPNTSLPNPNRSSKVVDALTITPRFYRGDSGGGIRSAADLNWLAVDFAQSYEIEYKKLTGTSPDTDFRLAGTTTNLTFSILDLERDQEYCFRVRVVTITQAKGPYTEQRQRLPGLSVPPEMINGFSGVMASDGSTLTLTWDAIDQSVDLDVIEGGSLIIRYTEEQVNRNWNSFEAEYRIPGASNSYVVGEPLRGSYMIRAVDSSGNTSLGFRSFVNTFSVAREALFSNDQQPNFAGSKTNFIISSVSGNMELEDKNLDGVYKYEFGDTDALGNPLVQFDDLTDVDLLEYLVNGTAVTVPNLDELVTDTLDFGFGRPVEVHIKPTALVVGASTIEWDTYEFIDGVANIDDPTESIRTTFEIRKTQQDPNGGGAAYSDWEPFFESDIVAHAIQVRLRLSVEGPSVPTISVSEAGFEVSAKEITQTGRVIGSNSSTTTLLSGNVTVDRTEDTSDADTKGVLSFSQVLAAGVAPTENTPVVLMAGQTVTVGADTYTLDDSVTFRSGQETVKATASSAIPVGGVLQAAFTSINTQAGIYAVTFTSPFMAGEFIGNALADPSVFVNLAPTPGKAFTADTYYVVSGVTQHGYVLEIFEGTTPTRTEFNFAWQAIGLQS